MLGWHGMRNCMNMPPLKAMKYYKQLKDRKLAQEAEASQTAISTYFRPVNSKAAELAAVVVPPGKKVRGEDIVNVHQTNETFKTRENVQQERAKRPQDFTLQIINKTYVLEGEEIHFYALLENGVDTGYVTTDMTGNSKLAPGDQIFSCRNRHRATMERFCDRALARIKKKEQEKQNEPLPVTHSFNRRPKFTDNQIHQIRLASFKLVAEKSLPFSFFESQASKDYFDVLNRMYGASPATVQQVTPSGYHLRKIAAETAKDALERLNENVKVLGPTGRISIMFDHKYCKFMDRDFGRDYLGILLSLRDFDNSRKALLISYTNVASKSNDATMKDVTKTLAGYGILEHCKKGTVSIVTDAALKGVATELSPSNQVCCSHTLANLLKRSVTINMKFFNEKGPELFVNLTAVLKSANEEINKSELRDSDTFAKSYNQYSHLLDVDEETQLKMASMRDKDFESRSPEYKKKAMSKLTRYPKIKSYCEVRFGSLHKELENLLFNENVIKAVMAEPSHSAYPLVNKWVIDWQYVYALYEFTSKIMEALLFFEAELHLTMPRYVSTLVDLLLWSVDLDMESLGDRQARYLGNLKKALCMTLGEYMFNANISEDGAASANNRVTNRITEAAKASIFLWFPSSSCKLSNVIADLKKAGTTNPQAREMAKIMQASVASWQTEAIQFLRNMHNSMQASDSTEVKDSQVNEELPLYDPEIDGNMDLDPVLKDSDPCVIRLQSEFSKEIERYLQFSLTEFRRFNHECGKRVAAGTLTFDGKAFEFWKQFQPRFPLLAKLAKIVLLMPSSSSSIERKFAEVSRVSTKQRNRLTVEKVQQIFVAESWMKVAPLMQKMVSKYSSNQDIF